MNTTTPPAPLVAVTRPHSTGPTLYLHPLDPEIGIRCHAACTRRGGLRCHWTSCYVNAAGHPVCGTHTEPTAITRVWS